MKYKFVVGNIYETQAGEFVKLVGRYDRHKGYETVFDEKGVHRYDRSDSDSDAGRVTGTAHDYSHPDNIIKQ